MSNKTLADSDVDSDDVWDDVEEDLDILDEDFEDDLDHNIAKKENKNHKNAKNSPKDNSSKRSSSKLLVATTGLAVLSGGAWFALTNNPDLLNLVMGMTTGEKYFEQTKVDLDKGQSSGQTSQDTTLPTDNISIDAQVTPLETPKSDVSASAESTVSSIQSQPVPDLGNSSTQQKIALPDEVSSTEDQGFLTPFPTESSQEELSENQSLALSDLEDNSPPVMPNIDLPKHDNLNEHSKQDDMTVDSIPLDATKQDSDLKLEENVLLDQTEKSYEEIPNKDPVAPPMPEVVAEEKDTLETLASDDLLNESHKDTIVPIDETPGTETALPSISQSKDLAPNIGSDISSRSANAKAADKTNSAEGNTTKDKSSQDVKQASDIEKKNAEAAKIVSDLSTSSKSIEKPKSEDKKAIVTVEKKSDKKNKVSQNPTPVRKWSLRSASANSAVLLDKSSGNIVSIGIGSHVEGLGKIKLIAKENGKWVVKGTKGSIAQ